MVACFLTRGGCYIDWERGAEVFEEWLLDHEVACNAGNWQWLSCTAFYAQFHRCYSPIAFGRKWDPDGAFIRKYVPELEKYDKKYIYEPWKAPIVDQKKWGCLIKGDGGEAEKSGTTVYPKPMFDFTEKKNICLDGMKNAYRIGLYGNDKRVLDGTWRKLFDDDAEGPTQGDEGLPGAQVEGMEEMDADGTEHEEGDYKVESKNASKATRGKTQTAKSKSKPTHKREASQSTLDGMVTRKKKKDQS